MKRMTIDRACEEQLLRLTKAVVMCDEAKAVPRRLGGNATDQELADDKRICRRVRHRLLTCAEDWNEGQTPDLPKGDGSGARVQWATWWNLWSEGVEEWIEWFEARDAHNKYIHRLRRELEGLKQVFA